MATEKIMTQRNQGKTAVVGWGRGMGHKGHMLLARAVIIQAQNMGADPYFFVSRTVGADDPLYPEEKLYIYKKVFPKQANIFQSATDEIPDINRLMRTLAELGYKNAVLVVGADQVKAFQYLVGQDKAGNVVYKTLGLENLSVIKRQDVDDAAQAEEGPRATPMREILKDPNASDEQKFEVWRDAMPDALSDNEVLALMQKASQRMGEFKPATKKAKIKEFIQRVRPMLKEANVEQKVKILKLIKESIQTISTKDVKEGNVIFGSDLIDVFIKGKHNKKEFTYPIAKAIPNNELDKIIKLLITKYNVNPNAIIYGPSKDKNVKEGEILQFKRPEQRQLTYKDLPPKVLKLANDWFWQEEDSMGLDAVMDPKGFGSGPKNAMQHTSAILQTLGWKIGWDDEYDNIVLTNKKGQSVMLPSMDAYDFTGWAEGSNADLRETEEPFNLPNRHTMDYGMRKAMIHRLAKATDYDVSDLSLASDEELSDLYKQIFPDEPINEDYLDEK